MKGNVYGLTPFQGRVSQRKPRRADAVEKRQRTAAVQDAGARSKAPRIGGAFGLRQSSAAFREVLFCPLNLLVRLGLRRILQRVVYQRVRVSSPRPLPCGALIVHQEGL
jgi:hypothetical protein